MFKKFIFISLFVTSVCFFAKGTYASTTTYIVDSPTYSILDYGSYDVQFRVFSGGGVLTKINFGVFQILNLGVSWELGGLIGSSDVTIAVPSLQVKCNIYSGDEKIPGFAVGYDGQGFFYDKDDGDFLQKGTGIYLVAGKELFFPTLNFNVGINMNDFKKPGILGFINVSYEILEESITAMLEYSNIGQGRDARLSGGFRVWITENFDIDFILRNFMTTDEYRFGCERILKISYQGRF